MKAKIQLFLLIVIGVLWMPQVVFAGAEYQSKLESGLSRGVRNIIGAPLEIPVTIHQYHKGDGRFGIRHTAGLVDGTFQMLSREVSGILDTLLVLMPGEQDGIPLDPETMF